VNIILIGPPGAGKGTQTDNIIKNFNMYKVSTGDLLREEIKKKTDLGEEIKSIIDEGLLVPDNIVKDLIVKILSNKKFHNQLIFDGYPRNLNQAKNLSLLFKKYNQTLTYVLSLRADLEIIIKRILGRQICANCGKIFNHFFKPATNMNHSCDKKFLRKRSDDNEKTIVNRFDTYKKETLPILDYYRKQNLLHEINGMGKINEIYEEIRGIISPLEA